MSHSSNGILPMLEKQLEQLNEFAVGSGEYEEASEKLSRWKDRTARLIEKNISQQEAKKFKEPGVIKMVRNPWMGLQDRIKTHKSRLSALIDEIKNHPEEFADNSEAYKHKAVAEGTLSAMHPQVVEVTKNYVESGHYRGAIVDAFVALETYVKEKTKQTEVGAALMQKVFSKDNPIIKLSDELEEQQGFMFLFSGAMKSIRNQYAHNIVEVESLQEAIEILGFASFLFRLVDKGNLILAGTSTEA